MANSTLVPTSCEDYLAENVTYEDVPETWQDVGVHVIQTYLFPVVLILSWINNSVAIVVLLSKTYRKTSTGFLMIILAIADIGVVSTGMFRLWIQKVADYDLRLASRIACKMHVFFTYVTVNMSAWSLTVISLERTISVCNPLRCREIASPRRIRIACAVILLIICGVYSTLLWTYDLYWSPETCTMVCRPIMRYMHFWKAGNFQFIDLIMSSLGPFAVILPCNLVITIQIARSRARRSAMSTCSASSKGVSSTTLMLAVTCVLFLILTAPMAVILLVLSYGVIKNYANIQFIYTFCYLLFNLNSSINFLLYCASGTKFRRTLAAVCCGRKPPTRGLIQSRPTVRGSATTSVRNGVTAMELRRRGTSNQSSAKSSGRDAVADGEKVPRVVGTDIKRAETTADVSDVKLE
ncbi:hypothetical protein LSH36_555g03019 [Paralvinella palmiformis]|uniref:G-protein coupled receptors family 1 profile domain-containing protein n=1 Tax=Paralvinella palmiformis TaxID=53620 RepID=A0AAD9MX47_9ANNE|nr:hypothetical protein LSH36_555g03019 [Paralvinella palmiformis]